MQEKQSADSHTVMETRRLEVVKEVPVKAAGGGLLGDSMPVPLSSAICLAVCKIHCRLSSIDWAAHLTDD